MSRSALSSIGKAIAASTEEKTLDELTARGRNKFRVVSGKKVTQIIQAIVDDVIEQEAGDIAKRDRDSLVKQTQRKFERVMRLQAEQDARLAQLQEQLGASDDERRALKSDKAFLEEQLEAARKSAPEGEAVRLLTRELGRVKAGLDALDHKTRTLDGSSIERLVDRLGDREAQLTEHFHDELDEMRAKLDKMSDESEGLRNAAVEAVFERLIEKRAAWDDGLVSRIDERIEEMGSRLADLAEQATRRETRSRSEFDDHLGEIDARLAAVEEASAKVKDEAVATLLDRLADREVDVEKGFVSSVVSKLEALSAQVQALETDLGSSQSEETGKMVAQLSERIAAIEETLSKETRALVGALDEMTSATQGYEAEIHEVVSSQLASTREALLAELDRRFQERDARLSNAYLENLADVRASVEEIRATGTERDNFLQSLVSSQLEETRGLLLAELNDRFAERDVALAVAFRDNMADVRSCIEDLGSQTARQLAGMQVSLASGVDALRGGNGTQVDETFLETLEARLVTPLTEGMSQLREEVDVRHHEALAAVAAADERGNALAERLEQLAECVVSLGTRVDENAEAQARAVAELGERMEARAEAAASGQNERFDAALETALDKITRTMESATAKPIEISAEATDVLLNKIFDATDKELSSNLGQLDVEERRSGAGISKNLGRLRAARGARVSENGTK